MNPSPSKHRNGSRALPLPPLSPCPRSTEGAALWGAGGPRQNLSGQPAERGLTDGLLGEFMTQLCFDR